MNPARFAICLLLPLAAAGAAAAAPPRGGVARVEPVRASVIDLGQVIDANAIRMFVTNTGSFGYDKVDAGQPAGLEFPKGTGYTAVFASGLWLGGLVGGQLRVALSEYRDEFGPGSAAGGVPADPSLPQFKVYKLLRVYGSIAARDAALADYNAGAMPYGASPVSVLPDGSLGILGDQMLWAVYNDLDLAHHTSPAGSTAPLGVEVQQTTFAFDEPGPLENTVFVRFKIVNRSSSTIESLYAGIWSDPDVGNATDDLVGCDVSRSLGLAYNGDWTDTQYGPVPPAVGYDLLRGPVDRAGGATLGLRSFIKYIGGSDPNTAQKTYNYLQGLDPDGNAIVNPVTGAPTLFMVSGDPLTGSGWLDRIPTDRRMLLGTGPLTMAPADSQEIDVAIVIGRRLNYLTSFAQAQCYDDYVQLVFDGGLARPFPPPPDSTACLALVSCPRAPDYWTNECAGLGPISPEHLLGIAACVDSASTLFDWPAGAALDPFCATLGPPAGADLRARARQEFAAFLANLCAGDLGIESGSNQPIRLLRATPIACTGLRARTIGELAERLDPGRSLKDARYSNDNESHAPGLVGVDFGLRFFGGGADFAYNLFGSALNPADPSAFHPVEIRFTGGAPGQKAYRYLRCSCSPRTYLIQDFVDVPWTVWNVEDPANPIQLNAAWSEQEFTADGRWDPRPLSVDTEGGAEPIWVMASAYSPVADPYYFDPARHDILNEANQLDLQYVLWPAAAEDAQRNPIPIDAGDRFVFELGIGPTPGVDSLLVALQERPLSDPDVQQGYQKVIDCLGAINRGTGIGPVCGPPRPMIVTLVRAEASPDRATVLWQVEEPGAPATVYRKAPGRDWEALSRLHADGSGIVGFEDRDVVPGARYGYRIGLGDQDAGAALGEVWLEIPVAASLALYGLQPNPSRADLVVAFSLATRQPATIELFDLSGRRALVLPLGAPGPGSQLVKLGDRGRFSPGVYWLRLTQGARSATRKVVVLE